MTLKRAWIVGGAALVAIVVVIALLVPTLDFAPNARALQVSEQHVQRGIQLYKQGAYPESIAELRSALDGNPAEWRAPYYMGVIEIDFKQYGRAIPYLEQALRMNPAESQVAYSLGVTYYKLGRLDMARGYFAAALELDPANADAKALFETMAKLQRYTELAATEKLD